MCRSKDIELWRRILEILYPENEEEIINKIDENDVTISACDDSENLGDKAD